MVDYSKKPVTWLKDMKVREISLVEEPASPGCYVIMSKSRDAAPSSLFDGVAPIEIRKGREFVIDDLLAKADAGTLTSADVHTARDCGALVLGDGVTPEEVVKALCDVRKEDAAMSTQDDAALAAVFNKARANLPTFRERLPDYQRRIIGKRHATEIEATAVEAVFAKAKREEAMSRNQDTEVRKACANLDSVAKQIATAQGISFQKAWTQAVAARPDLYGAIKSAGGFAIGIGDAAATVRKGFSPDDVKRYYAHDDVTPESASTHEPDGHAYDNDLAGIDRAGDLGRVGTGNNAPRGNVAYAEDFDEVDDANLQLERCADDIRKSAGYKISKAQAMTRAYAALPEAYAKAKARGSFLK